LITRLAERHELPKTAMRQDARGCAFGPAAAVRLAPLQGRGDSADMRWGGAPVRQSAAKRATLTDAFLIDPQIHPIFGSLVRRDGVGGGACSECGRRGGVAGGASISSSRQGPRSRPP